MFIEEEFGVFKNKVRDIIYLSFPPSIYYYFLAKMFLISFLTHHYFIFKCHSWVSDKLQHCHIGLILSIWSPLL